MIRRLHQNILTVVKQYFSHRLGQNRKREFTEISRLFVLIGKNSPGAFQISQEILASVCHKNTAPLTALHIPFLRKKGDGMLHRDDTDTGFVSDHALTGKLAPIRIDPGYDIMDKAIINLQISRRSGVFINGVGHFPNSLFHHSDMLFFSSRKALHLVI